MNCTLRFVMGLILLASLCVNPRVSAQEEAQDVSVDEIRAVLESIDPYLPQAEVAGEIDVFGSTSMDAMAHGWAIGFKKFHPQAKIVISAEGSETVFARLAKNPASLGMVARPVTREDLAKLKEIGLQKPAALMVGREALGVFVHKDNPLDAVSYEDLIQLFCASEDSDNPTWSQVGLHDAYAKEAIDVVGREAGSGTHRFLERFLFRNRSLRKPVLIAESNTKAIAEVEKNPFAVTIGGLKAGSHDARALHLRQDDTVIPSTDHAILVGNYPLTRPLTLILDLGRTGDQAEASREFARYAISQAGQAQAILAGFFPFDPPTLRAEQAKLTEETQP